MSADRKKAIVMLRCNVAPAGEPQRIDMVECFAWLSKSGLLAVPAMRSDLNVTHVPTGMGIVPARDETEAFALMDALDVIPGWERVSIEGIGNDAATHAYPVCDGIASPSLNGLGSLAPPESGEPEARPRAGGSTSCGRLSGLGRGSVASGWGS